MAAEESDRAHAPDDDEMPDTTPGYQVAEKVDIQTMMDKDKEDESLRRYKEQLLGSAAGAEGSNASSDPRHVIIEQMKIKVEGRDDIVVPVRAAAGAGGPHTTVTWIRAARHGRGGQGRLGDPVHAEGRHKLCD